MFQAGGGADAAYTHACVTRGWFAAPGELGAARRDRHLDPGPSLQPGTAAAAGFKVITLTLEEDGYPSLEALKAAIGPRTAALMINNPDDMGLYNPQHQGMGAARQARPARWPSTTTPTSTA